MDAKQNPTRPLVSVLLNSYNNERYISEQIGSILSQTYSNLELVVCDDRSTDRTLEIVREHAQKDSRIKWLQNEKNLGIKMNYQKGIALCSGEFIAPSDGDDFWLPRKIEIQIQYLQAHPEADLVFTDSIISSNDLKTKLGSFQEKLGNPFSGKSISMEVMLKRNLLPSHAAFFRRKLVEKILPVPEGFTHDSWTALVGALNAPLGYINEGAVLYRQHESALIGAWVRDTPFYLKRFSDPAFLLDYYQDKSGQLAGHQKLAAMGGDDAARRALQEKIANEATLLDVVGAASFGAFISKIVRAALTILGSSQKYHLKQWAFLALSWGGIRKLRLHTMKV